MLIEFSWEGKHATSHNQTPLHAPAPEEYSTFFFTVDSNNIKNYRPISNLPFLSKLIELITANQLQLGLYLSSNGLMSKYQSTSRKFYSSKAAILRIQNDILVSLDSGHSTALLLLDLSAAFDTIDHNILLHRFKTLVGITSTVLLSLSSFLANRFQTVVAQNHNLFY